MILDNTASGSPRLFRELGALLVDPVRGANRFFRGDMSRDASNPDDRLPSEFLLEVDAKYQHLESSNSRVVRYANQGLVSILLRYGDSFRGPNQKPFDVFELVLELGPKGAVGHRWLERGQLVSWEVSRGGSSEHRLGVFLNLQYVDNQTEIFSAQTISANLLSRLPLQGGLDVRTEVIGVFYPIVAVGSDYPDANNAAVGRTYDYGLGAGASGLARLEREGLDLLLVGYDFVWSSTKSGLSVHSTIQSFRVQARYPLSARFALGADYGYSRRVSSYVGLPTATVTSPRWSAFAALTLR